VCRVQQSLHGLHAIDEHVVYWELRGERSDSDRYAYAYGYTNATAAGDLGYLRRGRSGGPVRE
jgi:hypothetical protein